MSKTGWFITIFLIAGLGWAAWDDFNKKDEEWLPNECNPGLESTIHQNDQGNWVVGLRSDYADKLSVFVRIESPKDSVTQVQELRPAEVIFLDVSKLKDPVNAKVIVGPASVVKQNGELGGMLICDEYVNNK